MINRGRLHTHTRTVDREIFTGKQFSLVAQATRISTFVHINIYGRAIN